MTTKEIKRGDIYYADLSPVLGSEQGGLRPVVIIQNDIGNKHSPTTIVAPLTSRHTKKPLPTHLLLTNDKTKLKNDSILLAEQIRVIDKQRLRGKMGALPLEEIDQLNKVIKISLGLD